MREIWKKLHWIATFLLKRLLPKKSLARTSFLAKKQSVPPKAGLQILLEKWGGKGGGPAARPPRSGCFCIFFYKTGVFIRLRSNLFYAKFLTKESHSAPPPFRRGPPPPPPAPKKFPPP